MDARVLLRAVCLPHGHLTGRLSLGTWSRSSVTAPLARLALLVLPVPPDLLVPLARLVLLALLGLLVLLGQRARQARRALQDRLVLLDPRVRLARQVQ